MPRRYNPFEPNKPVNPYMFAGRKEEIEQINNSLLSTIDGNPKHLLFLGERGIGKSSLLLLAKFLAEGDITLNKSDRYKLINIYIQLNNKTDIVNLCKHISKAIERVYRANNSLKQAAKDVWSFVQRCEVSGTKVNSERLSDETEILDNFVESIGSTVTDLIDTDGNAYDGIVLLIDEVDRANEKLELGLLVKKLTEYLAFNNIEKVLLILSGLPSAREVLLESHPSSPRIFEEIYLKPLKHGDCSRIVKQGVEKANEKLDKELTIEADAIRSMAYRSEGYPHFIQQYASCAYDEDTDYCIDTKDVSESTYRAIKLIGDRYYKDLFYTKIKKEPYRDVFRPVQYSFSALR